MACHHFFWSLRFENPILAAGVVSGVPESISLDVKQHASHYEAIALINSIIVSTLLYPVNIIELHFVINREDLAAYFESHIRKVLAKLRNYRTVITTKYYLLSEVLPEKYQREFSFLEASLYARLYLPEIIRSDAIMYLDTDILITGSLWIMWEQFTLMKREEIALIAYNNDPSDRNYEWKDKVLFSDIPHVDVKGVNGGVQLMNLTKMRDFNFTSKCMSICQEYVEKGSSMNDQRVVNILFNKYRSKLRILPCKFNFQHVHCDKGLTCSGVRNDVTGIQVIHGAGGTVEGVQAPFFKIYSKYLNFDFSKDHIQQLIYTIKLIYTRVNDSSTCFGNIGKYLYKNVML
ncbi:unnamed protein product [Orchesella dallaii]|uniref:UDP-D-xylose:beta-D-glucoside alpha-1,3-D-xylosyltransferase n=1 Tax=Orchesella dallaii TaxID=48710 RepID=A0ABP1QC19_9HEXA